MSLWVNLFIATITLLIPTTIVLESGLHSVPIWTTLIIFGFSIFRLVLQRHYDFLYASLLCFFYIFLILAPLLQMQHGTFPWVDFYYEEDVYMAWWITCLALLFFEFGYLLFQTLPAYKKLKPEEITSIPRLTPFGGGVLALSAVLLTILGLAFTGVDSLFLPRNEAALMLGDKVGGLSPVRLIISSLMRVPPVIIMLVLLYDFYLRRMNNPEQPWFTKNTLYLVLVGLIVAIVNNPVSTARFWVGAIVLSVVLLLLYSRKKNTAFMWFTLNLSIVILVFPLSDIYRKSLDVNPLEDELAVMNPSEELVTSPDFDAFQQQVNVKIVTDEAGFQYGRQILSSVFFFVPRVFWPNKSEATGVLVANQLNYKFDNLSTPLMAEFYIDAGIPGVVIGMLLLGMLYQYLNLISRKFTILVATFYCLLASYQFYLLRGSLMTVTNYLVVAIATYWVLYYFRDRLFAKDPLTITGKVFYRRVYQ